VLIVKSLTLIFIAWIFDVSVAYIAFAAIGYNIPVGVVMTIYSMMVLVTLIPAFVPGGLGYVDGLMSLLYSAAGVNKNDAFSGLSSFALSRSGSSRRCGLCALSCRATGKERTTLKHWWARRPEEVQPPAAK
jgi:hypothetical protein